VLSDKIIQLLAVKYGKLSSCRTLSKHDVCFLLGCAPLLVIKCFNLHLLLAKLEFT
jgi:hypothetical protein